MKTESFEKKRCPKELCIEQYFGVQFNENYNPNADFGGLADLLQSYEQHIQSNPSEFGLVKKESLSVSERFRLEDAHSAINRENELRAQLERYKHQADQLAEALRELIQVKAWKDKHGKDEYYHTIQPVAWEKAQTALTNYEQQNS